MNIDPSLQPTPAEENTPSSSEDVELSASQGSSEHANPTSSDEINSVAELEQKHTPADTAPDIIKHQTTPPATKRGHSIPPLPPLVSTQQTTGHFVPAPQAPQMQHLPNAPQTMSFAPPVTQQQMIPHQPNSQLPMQMTQNFPAQQYPPQNAQYPYGPPQVPKQKPKGGGAKIALGLIAILLLSALTTFGIITLLGSIFTTTDRPPVQMEQSQKSLAASSAPSKEVSRENIAATLQGLADNLDDSDIYNYVEDFYISYLNCINYKDIDYLNNATYSVRKEVTRRMRLPGNKLYLFEYGSCTPDTGSRRNFVTTDDIPTVELEVRFFYSYYARDGGRTKNSNNVQTIQLVYQNEEWMIGKFSHHGD